MKQTIQEMKTKTRILTALLVFVCAGTSLQAQFFKKMADRAAKAAEETVLQKVDEKASRKTGKTMDTIFDGGATKRKKKASKSEPAIESKESQSPKRNGQRNATSAKDFTPGNKVVFSDTFANDAIGDFPVTWNTNASAEVVVFEGDNTRWLQLGNSGIFTPDGITTIPENTTLEFDLYVDDNYSFYSGGMTVGFVEVHDVAKDFMKWDRLNGVRLWLHPVAAGGGAGRTSISNLIDYEKVLGNVKNFDRFTKTNNLVHVAIWRQKTRIRVYVDDQKVWDIPRAFSTANYNSLVFSVGSGNDDAHYYISNLRLAVAGEDKRHALLETGKFETNEILFDVGKSSLQMGSTTVLDELGELLEQNEELNLSIIGHTDADGTPETNQKLSEERARSVKEYLTDNYTIKGNRLQYEGKGATVPVAPNTTEEGKRKNRRVEFIKM